MKKFFVLAALAVLFAAPMAKAEVMEYLGTSADVQVELKAWNQQINETPWAQVCLTGNPKQASDASHFDIAHNHDGKCSGKGHIQAFQNGLFDTSGIHIGHLIDIPVEVPDKDKRGCEKGKEKECPQFDHYRSYTTQPPDAPQAKPDSAEQNASAEPVVQSATSSVDFLLPLKGFTNDAVVDMFYVGEVANPAQTIRIMEGEAKAMGTVDACIFSGYPLKTQDVDEQNRPIYQIKFAMRFCAQPFTPDSHVAIFGFTFGIDGDWYRVYISYRSSHGNYHLFVADNPRREKSQSTPSL